MLMRLEPPQVSAELPVHAIEQSVWPRAEGGAMLFEQ